MGTLLDTARDSIAQYASPITADDSCYDELLDDIGEARIVLIGEASHGTHEFYAERARITRLLTERRGCSAIALEADWPDALRIGQYVRGTSTDGDALSALSGFDRFPRWMWRNTVMLDVIDWLRERNAALDPTERTGVYGLDLYSMFESIHHVLRLIADAAPDALDAARARYACFDHVGDEAHEYGFASARGLLDSCEDHAVDQVRELHAMRMAALADGSRDDPLFDAEQNARLVRDAEEYYRIMYRGGASSWNLRDRHMADTLAHIDEHLRATGAVGPIVVWEHNSHLGDARSTDMTHEHEFNVGQLVRERWGHDTYSIGLTTFTGTVTAAHGWHGEPERMQVREALHGSYERLLHEATGADDVLLLTRRDRQLARSLTGPLLERAIGVVYRPNTERTSHYFAADLPRQFDAVVHLDTTTALEPIDPPTRWSVGAAEEPPEAYPSGL